VYFQRSNRKRIAMKSGVSIFQAKRLLPLLTMLFLAVWMARAWRVPPFLNTDTPALVLPAEIDARIREGDLIFRIGTEWQGDMVRALNASNDIQAKPEDPYTHVGILSGKTGNWRVLHNTPSEKPGIADGVVEDDLAFFMSMERARGIAIYRVVKDEKTRAAAVAFVRSRLGASFALVENDTEGSYCTTLIWKAWQQAGVDLGVRFDRITLFSSSSSYLLPPTLRHSKQLSLIYETPGR
jgi:hypothetical protein